MGSGFYAVILIGMAPRGGDAIEVVGPFATREQCEQSSAICYEWESIEDVIRRVGVENALATESPLMSFLNRYRCNWAEGGQRGKRAICVLPLHPQDSATHTALIWNLVISVGQMPTAAFVAEGFTSRPACETFIATFAENVRKLPNGAAYRGSCLEPQAVSAQLQEHECLGGKFLDSAPRPTRVFSCR